jgi:ubiquinone/menaquinone biosynthesis C-methylase UbiE
MTTTLKNLVKQAIPSSARQRLRQWQHQLRQRAVVADLGLFLPQKYVAELAFQKDMFVGGMRKANVSPSDMTKSLRAYWTERRYLLDIERLVAPEGREILDVGCGIATVLRVMQAKRKVAVDPLLKYYCKLWPDWDGIECVTSPMETLPFADASFDVVCCTNALDHVTSPERGIAEMTRVLRPGGHILLTVEVFPEASQGTREDEHPFSFDEPAVVELLKEHEIQFRKPTIAPQFRRYLLGMPIIMEGSELVVVGRSRRR